MRPGYWKPRRPRELNKLRELLRSCGVEVRVERTSNDVPFVEVGDRRVCWFHGTRVFRCFATDRPPHRRGDVISGVAAASYLLRVREGGGEKSSGRDLTGPVLRA